MLKRTRTSAVTRRNRDGIPKRFLFFDVSVPSLKRAGFHRVAGFIRSGFHRVAARRPLGSRPKDPNLLLFPNPSLVEWSLPRALTLQRGKVHSSHSTAYRPHMVTIRRFPIHVVARRFPRDVSSFLSKTVARKIGLISIPILRATAPELISTAILRATAPHARPEPAPSSRRT